MNLSKERLEKIKKFEESIGYTFKDKNLIDVAFTHSSYINETKEENKLSNERLEFLGDSVLDLIVSEELYKNHKNYPEGKLTKIRSRIVCTSSFSKASEKFNLSDYLLFGKGEINHQGKNKKSVKADTFEAFCAALYLDAGYDYLKNFLLKNYLGTVKKLLNDDLLFIDYKTKLQEYFNKTSKIILKYKLVKEEGPEHDKTFYMEVYAKNKKLSQGFGKNKKEAEQMAAKKAYKKLTNV
ncbi:ribonuclease III [Anaerococcus sp. AGMB00486]|uniref:Ribonuclease 3 n=2 Tax=Anaerococcus TaxID=165779 RepID=A0ABX2N8N7_9FIRM|nr:MULTISPECIES: ribonuclease III [Anaerococcus]MSS77162.1 ribonuclease III [Anaerococcus porci]NVF11034.1 ribonuclease III [Anaerococcus faecalis]